MCLCFLLLSSRCTDLDMLRQRRGERRHWTRTEDDALRRGVRKYTLKNKAMTWMGILKDPEFHEVLRARNNIDLKDRWRNLQKIDQREALLSRDFGGLPKRCTDCGEDAYEPDQLSGDFYCQKCFDEWYADQQAPEVDEEASETGSITCEKSPAAAAFPRTDRSASTPGPGYGRNVQGVSTSQAAELPPTGPSAAPPQVNLSLATPEPGDGHSVQSVSTSQAIEYPPLGPSAPPPVRPSLATQMDQEYPGRVSPAASRPQATISARELLASCVADTAAELLLAELSCVPSGSTHAADMLHHATSGAPVVGVSTTMLATTPNARRVTSPPSKPAIRLSASPATEPVTTQFAQSSSNSASSSSNALLSTLREEREARARTSTAAQGQRASRAASIVSTSEIPECVICHAQMSCTDVLWLPCSHGFHGTCYHKWVYAQIDQGAQVTCPCCRAPQLSSDAPRSSSDASRSSSDAIHQTRSKAIDVPTLLLEERKLFELGFKKFTFPSVELGSQDSDREAWSQTTGIPPPLPESHSHPDWYRAMDTRYLAKLQLIPESKRCSFVNLFAQLSRAAMNNKTLTDLGRIPTTRVAYVREDVQDGELVLRNHLFKPRGGEYMPLRYAPRI